MDIYKVIDELIHEKKRLDAVIASLESRSDGPVREKKRRGRKSMNAAERKAVSQRMAAYWAARRDGSSAEAGPTPMARAVASGAEALL